MLLAQKPQPLNFSRHHRRRHPASLSNIAVVPHPTSTPGLFALSKPPRQPPRHPQRSQSPRFPPRSRLHRPTTSASMADRPQNAARGVDQIRGRPRQLSRAQTEQPRSTSQGSPPNTLTSTPPESKKPSEQVPSPTPPALLTQPTGRLARSRRTRHKSTPVAAAITEVHSPERTKSTPAPPIHKKPQPSTPIPVPDRARSQSPSHKILSRSDPLSKMSIHTHLSTPPKGRHDKRRRNAAKQGADGNVLPLAEWDFPAPGPSDDEEPVTPAGQTGANDKAWYTAFNDGPKTAPLQSSVTRGQFPFFTFPPRVNGTNVPRARTPVSNAVPTPVTPTKSARPPHRRAPSQPASLSRASPGEAIFHFSEDEGEGLQAGADVREKMALLFRSSVRPGSSAVPFFGIGTPSPSPRRHRASRERESMDGSARQLFASSSFQIAPEPVDLPKPSFLLGLKA